MPHSSRLDRETGRRSHQVLEKFRARRDPRQIPVTFRHRESQLGETPLDPGYDPVTDLYFPPERVDGRLPRHIVHGRAEPARDHDGVAPLRRSGELIADKICPVGKSRRPPRRDPGRCKGYGKPYCVVFNCLAAEDLVPDRDYLDPHSSSVKCLSSTITARA